MNEHVQPATSAPLFNPLAPEFIRNPYPYYEKLRTTDPVHLTEHGMYLTSRHADIALVLRDKRFGKDYPTRMEKRYGPDIMKEPMIRNFALTMLQQDAPDLVGIVRAIVAIGKKPRPRIERPAQDQDRAPRLLERLVERSEVSLGVDEERTAVRRLAPPAGLARDQYAHPAPSTAVLSAQTLRPSLGSGKKKRIGLAGPMRWPDNSSRGRGSAPR